MAKTADALHGHQAAGLRLRFAQCVVGREAGAEQRRRLDGRQLLGDRDQAGLATGVRAEAPVGVTDSVRAVHEQILRSVLRD